jgi:hypothetical protein
MSENSISIRSDQLAVEIARPGKVYQGKRFDWSGFITQVTLDGTHTFCVPESYQPGQGTGGIGLCNEFGIDMPLGYTDAKPGELFPKLGIGLLQREEEPAYNFFKPYTLVTPFPMQIQEEENRAVFLVEPVETRGYAAKLTKTLSVSGKTLQIAYHLENTGSQPLKTNEYCHNFMAIDAKPMGPEYRLRFPYVVKFEELSGQVSAMGPKWMRYIPKFIRKGMADRRARGMQSILQVNNADFSLRETPKTPFYTRTVGFTNTDLPQWELTYLPTGLGMREYNDFSPWRVAIWGVTHVISVEVFIAIDLQPGQAMQWSRRYEFLEIADE